MPFSIFRNRTLTGANVVGILTGASLFSMFFFISLYMQNVLGYSAIKAGLSYLPLALSIIVAAGVASTLVTRIGYKPILAAGMVLIAAGLFWFSQISADGTFLGDVLGPSLLAAVGLGFAFVPQTIAAVSGVKEHLAGLASGLINTSQQVGGALGLAVLSTVAFPQIDDNIAAVGRRPRRDPRNPHRGLRGRVPRRRRDRGPGPDRDAGPDPRQGLQGPHGDRRRLAGRQPRDRRRARTAPATRPRPSASSRPSRQSLERPAHPRKVGVSGTFALGVRFGEGLARGVDRALDRGLVVGERDEPGLELRRRRVDPRARAAPGRSAP